MTTSRDTTEIIPDLTASPDRLYTVPDVAKFLNVSSHTVRLWIKSGKLEAIKLNGYWRVSHRAVQEYVRGKLSA